MPDSLEPSDGSLHTPASAQIAATKQNGYTAELIQSEVDAILASDAFRRARRSSRLLTALVGYSLQNRGDDLKEYTLGVEVFDRTPAFDPRLDPIVRVEMGRLRKKLDDYYARDGAGRVIRIQVPLRRYSVVFLSQAADRTSPPEAAPFARRRYLGLILSLVPLLVVGGSLSLFWHFRQASARERASAGEASIAVLPFSDLRAGANQDLAADALTEEVIEALEHIDNLRIISRLASSYYKGRGEDVIEIGRRLGVKYLLEGSLNRTGDQVRIIARLIDAADGHRLWSRPFVFNPGEAPALEQLAARRIVDELRQKLGKTFEHPFVDHTTTKEEAYINFLKGSSLLQQFSGADLRKSLHFFEKALAIDPSYASAWSGAADAYAMLADCGEMEAGVALEKARSAANRALSLHKDMARAHASRAYVKAIRNWEWAAADAEFRLAHDLDPGDARIHEEWVLGCLLPTRQFDEALKQIREAQELDPVSVRITSAVAITHYFRREYEAAIALEQRALELDSGFYPAHLALADVYAVQGRGREAAAELEKWSLAAARKAEMPADRDLLLQWLEEAARKRLPIVSQLGTNPRFDPLRSSPAFQNLLQKAGLLAAANRDASHD